MESNQTQRVVLTNAFALSMFGNPNLISVEFRRITLQQLREIAKNAVIVNYIRHPSTVNIVAQALGRQLEPNSGIYSYSQGDIVVIVTLAQPQRGQEIQAQPEDLILYQLTVRELA